MKAFPTTKPLDSWDDPNQGMDLRDYFAAKAMQAMITNESMVKSHHELSLSSDLMPMDYLVSESYEIADAMMKARGE